jgi:hypothetical protein
MLHKPSGIDSSSLYSNLPSTRLLSSHMVDQVRIAMLVPALSFKAQTPVLFSITSFSSSVVVGGGSHELKTRAHVTRCVLPWQVV